MTTVFSGPAGVATYQAITLKHALVFYAKTGCKVNRAYTPKRMMALASHITGQTFKPRGYQAAIDALEAWIQANGTSGEQPARAAGRALMSHDDTESIRREMLETGQPQRDLEQAEYRWDSDQLRDEFEVIGFMAPFVVVRRKSDGRKGTLEFTHSPRFYFNFVED